MDCSSTNLPPPQLLRGTSKPQLSTLWRGFWLPLLVLGQLLIWALGSQAALAATDAVDAGVSVPPLVWSEHQDIPTAGQHLAYIQDPNGDLQLSALRAMSAAQWHPLRKPIANFGFTTDTYWLRLHLVNSGAEVITKLLEISYPALDRVDIYQFQKDAQIQHLTFGDSLPVSSRPVRHQNFVAPIQLAGGSDSLLYFRVHTTGSLQVPLSFWQPETFAATHQDFVMGQGLYYGLLMVMVLYNLFLYFSVRDASYIAYVLCVANYGLFQASLHGFAFFYLWPEHPGINAYAIALLNGANCFLVAFFTLMFLRLQQLQPRYYRWLLRYGLLMLGITLASLFISYNLSIRITAVLSFVGIILVTYVGIRMLYLGHRPARFFVLAWLVFLVASQMLTLNKLGWLQPNFFTEYGAQIGSALETLLLSFALADRINEERAQRFAAQHLALEHEKSLRQEQERYHQLQLRAKEDEMQAQQKVLEAKSESRAKSQFLATMSHEIRTPMSGVLGMAELLADTDLQPQQRQYVEVIERSGKTLLNVINDVLDYSRIEAGKMELENVDLDLDELCLECASVFALTAERKKLELICSIKPGTPNCIKSDPTRLRQILLNLLGNAFKFTHTGYVYLRVRRDEVDDLPPGQWQLRFEVRDSGIGIAPEAQARLFDAFTQAQQDTVRRFGGSGLGLSICKRLTQLMGGSIGVDSSPGDGSLFWFTLRCEEAAQDFQQSQVVPFYDLRGKRLLIVDDSAEFTQILSEQAQAWGMQTDVAYYGEQALLKTREAHLAGTPYDIISLDMNMPGMTGLDCASILNRDPTLATSKRLLLTAMRSMPVKEELEAAGIHYAMQKPASPAALKGIFRQLLAGHSNDALQSASGKASVAPIFMGKRILVAEDNPVNQMIITSMLQKLGAEPLVAQNGKEAVARLFAAEPRLDLVLMDCEMPEMDGYQAAASIRALENQQGLPRTPIVALTAHALREHRQQSLEAGMDAHLSKPLDFQKLKDKLQRFLLDPAAQGTQPSGDGKRQDRSA